MEKEPKIERVYPEETLEKAKQFLEKARNSTGEDRINAVFECEGIFIDAGFAPGDLKKIGIDSEELENLIFQGDKETAKELLERARSSRGRERVYNAERCKEILECEAAKRKEIKAFSVEDIGTTTEELDELISEGDEEKL